MFRCMRRLLLCRQILPADKTLRDLTDLWGMLEPPIIWPVANATFTWPRKSTGRFIGTKGLTSTDYSSVRRQRTLGYFVAAPEKGGAAFPCSRIGGAKPEPDAQAR